MKKRAISSKYRVVGREVDHRTYQTVVRIELNVLDRPTRALTERHWG